MSQDCCSHEQSWIQAWGHVPGPFQPSPFPLASPGFAFSTLSPQAGSRVQTGLGSPSAPFPQFGNFFSFSPFFIPQSTGKEEQRVWRLKPTQILPPSQGKPSGKHLFVTDGCGSAQSSRLPSHPRCPGASSLLKPNRGGAWKQKCRRIPLFFRSEHLPWLQ